MHAIFKTNNAFVCDKLTFHKTQMNLLCVLCKSLKDLVQECVERLGSLTRKKIYWIFVILTAFLRFDVA